MTLADWSRAVRSPSDFDKGCHSEDSRQVGTTKSLGWGSRRHGITWMPLIHRILRCAQNDTHQIQPDSVPLNALSRDGAVLSKPATRHRRWSVFLMLAVLPLAVACSSSRPADQTVEVDRPPPITITKHVTASVLITSKPQDTTTNIDKITVLPRSIVADPGESVELLARALGPGGQPIPDIEFIWTVVDPRAGNVTREGKFQTGSIPGTFDDAISVTGLQNTPFGIRYESALVKVVVVGEAAAPKLSTVAIVPNNPTVLHRQIYRMRAVGFDSKGVVIPGVSFIWQVNDSTLGRLNDIGYLTV